MIKHLVRLVITGLMASSLLAQAADIPVSPSAAVNAKTTTKSTTDHSKLDALKGPFKTGPEVTKACLSCHNTAGHQVMKSIHWTWETKNPTTGKLVGKQWTANNFCGSPISNETRRTRFPARHGWPGQTFAFTHQVKVQCPGCPVNHSHHKKI